MSAWLLDRPTNHPEILDALNRREFIAGAGRQLLSTGRGSRLEESGGSDSDAVASTL